MCVIGFSADSSKNRAPRADSHSTNRATTNEPPHNVASAAPTAATDRTAASTEASPNGTGRSSANSPTATASTSTSAPAAGVREIRIRQNSLIRATRRRRPGRAANTVPRMVFSSVHHGRPTRDCRHAS